RIEDCKPKVVLSASCGIEIGRLVEYKPLLDKALTIAKHAPRRCVILQRPQLRAPLVAGRDIDWDEALAGAREHECVPVEATDPLYILYTSGTTGRPKGVVRDNGGHAVALRWSMRNFYGVEPGETFWAASDIGWVVGHSYIVYAPLLNGNATVLYEGKPVGTPDPGAFWRVAAEHDVRVLFTAPTALRAIKREDPGATHMRRYDLRGLRALFLAGERTDPVSLRWARTALGVPVIDHWWQTETGWAITGLCRGVEELPIVDGAAGRAVPGYHVAVLDAAGHEVAAGTVGSLAVKLPLPPGTFLGLWNADAHCLASYYAQFPGYYCTADSGFIDAEGYAFVMARTDDVINVAGHRLSTGAMEEVPIGLLVLNANCGRAAPDVVAEAIAAIRDRIGPVAAFKAAAVVNRLPKTRSGKILRGVMRRISNGEPWTMPATIDDPAILDEVAAALKTLGLPLAAS